MKKLFAIVLTILALMGVLCITAVAAEPTNEPAPGTVLRVRRQSGSNEPTFVADYNNFEEGWNAAMKLADDTGAHVIVDLYTDWISDEEGRFSDDWINGSGFKHDTIYFQNGIDFTLNMNGHKIHRRLADSEADGEVMYIDSNADVTINNGTITGGRTNNGAGGIHVNGARVYLNDVRVVDNKGLREDYGGGIALYGNSKLVMKGGELRDNFADHRGGAVYLGASGITAEFDNVKIINNGSSDGLYMGGSIAYIYGQDCDLKFTNCEMYANYGSNLIVAIEDNSNIYMDGCDIHGNAGYSIVSMTTDSLGSEHYLEVKNTRIHDNASSSYAFHTVDTKLYIENVTVVDNTTLVIGSNDSSGTIKNCTFNNNAIERDNKTIWVDEDCVNDITFYNCNFGDSTFKYEVKAVSTDSTGAVMGICVQNADGTLGALDYYKNLAFGWGDAITRAQSLKGKARMVVNFYTDWTAVEGEFSDDVVEVGFESDTIYVPQNVSVTLNLNGHKINRALTTDQRNGEVIWIEKNADVIINDGTITGGWSNNGAGGIHIKDNARVVLNNVNLTGNAVTGDEGAAIAVYGDAILVMKGGCISDNKINVGVFENVSNGAVYVEDSTVTFTEVTFSNNTTDCVDTEGVAIYADESTVTIDKCRFVGNAVASGDNKYACSVIYVCDAEITAKNCDFEGNASTPDFTSSDISFLFKLKDSELNMEGGKITGNNALTLFYTDEAEANMKGVSITENNSAVVSVYNDVKKFNLTECTLTNNKALDDSMDVRVMTKGTMTMTDCTFGDDTTFEDKSMVIISNKGVGSIFGEGSLAMIVSFVALIASAAALIVNISSKKKKETVPQKAAEDEES